MALSCPRLFLSRFHGLNPCFPRSSHGRILTISNSAQGHLLSSLVKCTHPPSPIAASFYAHSTWKWKWNLLSCVQLFAIYGLYNPWNSPGQNTGIAFPFCRGSSQPRDQTQVSHTAGGFFTIWATREPKNTGVGNIFLLQQTYPTQEWNWGPCIAGRFLTN